MTTGLISYSGIIVAKGGVYTQTRGVVPDRVSFRMIPQTVPIAAVGDVTMSFGLESIVIKDCLADKSKIWMTDEGFVGTIIFEDRRWRWSRYPLFSAYFNERIANDTIVSGSLTSLRAIVLAILTHIGEGTADVSRIANDVYPEINVRCVQADQLLGTICQKYNLEVCLGFGSESVVVWPQNSGSALPTGSSVMAASSTVDPPTPPQNVDICFGPSVAQARFKMASVGLDTNGEYKRLADLSYEPTGGWPGESVNFANVLADSGQTAFDLAKKSVYRTYAIDTFADGTLNYPDGTGTLSDITQVLPLFEKLAETQLKGGAYHHPPVRVYGKETSSPGFGVRLTSTIDSLLTVPFTYDRFRGLIHFDQPVFLENFNDPDNEILPAELYLECAFRIRDFVNRQFVSYVNSVGVNGSGFGTHAESVPEVNAISITAYGSNQSVSSVATNSAALNTYASAFRAAIVGSYQTQSRSMVWYNKPMNSIRLDGLTSQIRHVISDGTDGEPGHYTAVSQGFEFDSFVRSGPVKQRDRFLVESQKQEIPTRVVESRSEVGNDQ